MIAKRTRTVAVGSSVIQGVVDQTGVLKRDAADAKDALVIEMVIAGMVDVAPLRGFVSGIIIAGLVRERSAMNAQTAELIKGVVAMDVVYVVTWTSWMRLLKRSKLLI